MVLTRQGQQADWDDSMASEDDQQESRFLQLPAELRVKICKDVFDETLDPKKPLSREKCFPTPPIVHAWPELKMEIATEWHQRLMDEYARLGAYQRAIDAEDMKLGWSRAAQERAAVLDEESDKVALREAQVLVLMHNCTAEMSGTLQRRRGRLYDPYQVRGWPTSI